jgi:AGCS family alanine or glycine:cation symporter
MKYKIFSFLGLILLPSLFFANSAANDSSSNAINSVFEPIVKGMSKVIFYKPFSFIGLDIPLVVLWLVLGAVFFTVFMKFINVKGFFHAIQLVRGKYDDPDDKGEVSHFQALVTALSGTVGLGNIAGVAVAITLGGAGATFWMILAGLLGMSSKFIECTLGVKYRNIDENGEVSGGPMYYMSKGLKLKGYTNLGKFLAVIFAILCIGGSFGGGNMFQANQAFAQLSSLDSFSFLNGNGVWFGLILSLLVGVVIIGGIKSIANVTDKIVPLMVGIYVLSALVIIGLNFSQIGHAFKLIFNGAFSPDAAFGGIVGVLIVGFQRAAFSNEAGVGSASIAHAAAKTKEPVSEGIVALLEPFIDTVVVCTMTALVLIFTGFAEDNQGFEGAELTSAAFAHALGGWSKMVLAFSAVLFAFSTMISWSYYGLKSWTYLFGDSKIADYSYKTIFLLFIIVGSSSTLGAVIDFSDMMILGMAFPNIFALYFFAGEIKKDLADYFRRIKSGEIKTFK